MSEEKQYTLKDKKKFYSPKYIAACEYYQEQFEKSTMQYCNEDPEYYNTYTLVHAAIANIVSLTGIRYKDVCIYAHQLQENINLINGITINNSDDDLYFIESDNAIKIGRTINIKTRLSTLQTHNPEKLSVVLLKKNCGNYEKAIHRLFDYLKIKGEWFEKHGDLLEYINTLRSYENKEADRYSPFHTKETTYHIYDFK